MVNQNHYYSYFKESKDFRLEVLSTFFKELILFLLPLAILILLHVQFGEYTFIDFMKSSDLAYSIVVLQVLLLSKFIEHKVVLQKDKGHRLHDGLVYFVVNLVITTIVLVLIVLEEEGVISYGDNNNYILVFTSYFFTSSIYWLYMSTISFIGYKYRQEIIVKYETIESLPHAMNSLSTAKEELLHSLELMRRYNIKKEGNTREYLQENKEFTSSELKTLIGQNELLIDRLKEEYKRAYSERR